MKKTNTVSTAPFDPVSEIKAGRYVFDETLGLGKLTRLYTEPRFDSKGNVVEVASFPDDYLDFIDSSRLPDDCFIPTASQLEAWNTKRIGADWRDRPKDVLKEYGVALHGDNFAGKIGDIGYYVYLASASRSDGGSRDFLKVSRFYADLIWYVRCQCGFVPVFFGREFLRSSLEDLRD